MRLAAKPRFESAAVLALAAAVFAPGLAAEQKFPAKPITVIVPLAVGSPPETMARALGQFLAPTLGQPIVIVPRGGAGGTIGGQVVANAKPDGYTLLMGSGSSLAIGPALYPQAGFNAAQSFAPVGQVYSSPFVLMTGARFPTTTLTEFIAAVKAKPGGFNVTSPAAGGQPYMAGEMFKWAAGVDMVHVPFGNLGLAGNALANGQAHLMIAGLGTMMGQIRSGSLRVLATAAKKRLSLLPDVPTTAEAGLPGFEVDSWGGLVAPRGTPPAIIHQLNDAIQAVLAEKEFRDVLTRFGAEPEGGSSAQFGRLIEVDGARWAAVVKATGAKGE
jgi:tripartite-type tricarboxylate transporter receptor subunit TctC